MKHKYLALPLIGAALMLQSCGDTYMSDPENDLLNAYTVSWVKSFGLIAPDQDWNMAKQVVADIDPAAFGENVTIKIYNKHPRRGGHVIGIADETCSLYLDVVKDCDKLFVTAERDGKVIYNGYYTVQGNKLAIKDKSTETGPLLAPGQIEVNEGDNYFDWTIACEDLGTVEDFDFNDIVLGVRHIAGTNTIEITALAAGGLLKCDVLVNGESIGEIHELVQNGNRDINICNTYSWSEIGATVPVDVSPSWTITDNMGGITLQVEGRDAPIKAPATGTAPQMMCIAGDWLWPTERCDIRFAYPDFEYWTSDAGLMQWPGNLPVTKNIVEWKRTMTLPEKEYVAVAANSKLMVEAQGYQWTDGWYNAKKIWDYVPGLVAKAVLTYCEQYPDNKDIEFTTFDTRLGESVTCSPYSTAKDYADKAIDETGQFVTNGTIKAFVEGSLDNIASGKVLLSMWRITGETKYKNAADYLYNYLKNSYPRIEGTGTEQTGGTYLYNGFIHKTDYPYQMWLDGLYMGAAYYAEYLHTFGSSSLQSDWADVASQFRIIHTHTYDTDKQLNYHAWSAMPTDANSFWARQTAPYLGTSPEFWGRGMGWYFAALVDVLEYMPKSHPDYAEMVDILQDVAAGILRWQDSTHNVWYQLLQYKSDTVSNGTANYLEASASCMFTYAMLKGVRLGLLDRATYATAADLAYAGVLNEFVTFNGDGSISSLDHICKSAGLGPASKSYRDGSIDYYLNGSDAREVVSNEGKGIGPFIFASIEYELAHPQEVQ